MLFRSQGVGGEGVGALVSLVKDAQMDASMKASIAASGFASAKPLATVRVTTPAGVQTLEVRKLETEYYARSAVGTFKATPNLGPGVDKSLDDLQNKKLFDFGFDDPTKLTFKSKDDDKTFEKSGMDWLMNGRTMDSATPIPSLPLMATIPPAIDTSPSVRAEGRKV